MFVVCVLNDAQKFQKIWQVFKLIKQNRKAFIIPNILLQDVCYNKTPCTLVYIHRDESEDILPLFLVRLGPR
jgi:hypothetical protein